MKNMKRIVAAILMFAVLAVSTPALAWEVETPGETAARYIKGIVSKIAEDYRFGVDTQEMYEAIMDYVMRENPELLEGAISAAASTLDQHSEYFPAKELVSFVEDVTGAYVGIGVTIQYTDKGIEIVEVNPNGGAKQADLRVGDLIVKVDGQNVVGMTTGEVTSLVRGEENTTVALELLRGEERITADVKRMKLYTETVSSRITEDGIGYIYISNFASSTPESMKRVLDEMRNRNVRKFLIDVRDNPGGELGSVLDVLELFVPKNKVLTTLKYNNEKRNRVIKSAAKFSLTPNRKIVILANENSASAAELFAGTMQNLKLAKVVGVDTFGKGSMQEFMGLISPSTAELGDIKLSVAEFTKPDGSQINGIGIAPDVRVANVYVPYDMSKLTPMTFSDRYGVGSKGNDVLAIEERLKVLGLEPGAVDGVFDEDTKRATEAFQKAAELSVYGVMDFTTQNTLNDWMAEVEVEQDKQYEKAYEILKKEK